MFVFTFFIFQVLERLAKKPAEEEEEAPQLKLKVKTKGGKGDVVDRLKVENWSAEEQKSLEAALQLYPKGALERWDKISHMVPGRSKVRLFLIHVQTRAKLWNAPK